MAGELYRIAYYSHSLIEGSASEVRNAVVTLAKNAQKRNAAHSVSGALVFDDGCFAQVLEGELSAVERIFTSIQRDTRHCDLQILEYEPIEKRSFSNWSMGLINEKITERHGHGSLFEPKQLRLIQKFQNGLTDYLLLLAREQARASG